MKNRIKQVISEKNISQKELARMIGMSEVGMSKAINGSASRTTIDKVADALGIPVSELIEEDGLYAKYGSNKSPLKFGNIEVGCYVLNNGQRVLSGRGIQKAIGYPSKSGQWMNSFCNLAGLSTYLNAGENTISEQLSKPIPFKRNDAGGSQSITYGYEATLLVDICTAIIDAKNAGVFDNSLMVASANAIVVAVAKTGIIALVDEATGYNRAKSRARNELQAFLDSFLAKEASRWMKMFDDSFFEDLYKMHNWTWEQTAKKPQIVGKWINDIVYERIGPRIYAELQELNPANEKGNRRYKHHQLFTSDVGKPALREHLHTLHAFAILANYDWEKFMHNVDKVFPKKYQQLDMLDELYGEE